MNEPMISKSKIERRAEEAERIGAELAMLLICVQAMPPFHGKSELISRVHTLSGDALQLADELRQDAGE